MIGLSNFHTVVGKIIPYLLILGFFSAFVVWNGGVVLGKKYSCQHVK